MALSKAVNLDDIEADITKLEIEIERVRFVTGGTIVDKQRTIDELRRRHFGNLSKNDRAIKEHRIQEARKKAILEIFNGGGRE